MIRVLLPTALFASLAAFAAPLAAQPADPVAGKATAERWCAQCHVVGPAQAKATDTAPPFRLIARKPQWQDEKKLIEHLARPHPVMPNFSLTHAEVEDLMAYIATLRD